MAVLAADQASKTWAVRHLADHDVHVLGTLRFRLTYNSGGAFSLGRGSPWFFVAAAVVLVAVLFTVGRRFLTPVTALALGLVIGGAFGNLGDRLFRDTAGAVVDFVDLQWWPVFNVADAAITVGGLLLVLGSRRGDA